MGKRTRGKREAGLLNRQRVDLNSPSCIKRTRNRLDSLLDEIDLLCVVIVHRGSRYVSCGPYAHLSEKYRSAEEYIYLISTTTDILFKSLLLKSKTSVSIV